MDEAIKLFIEKQKAATICCVDEQNNPYCFSCFYALIRENDLLVIKSSASSNHVKLLLQKPCVSGTILPEKLNVFPVKGIQFTGMMLQVPGVYAVNAAKEYHKKFPFALAIPGEIYIVRLEAIKMTNSGKIFGEIITWQRNANAVKQW
ncbi:hypothetical protein FRZ67_18625 [Panacibacter ginsenosidivorans]|uniref:Uncharacterized protein n=1 Tax=Panacibacter ginsenosidivorans TaxID=1813871 RepID=A0A5B8VCG9_9BACT|nr:pyridoxamine 5'-phosphate oxidase family protein [Panacibacter ginsenosidivorans]QEC69227.1 hypothetical protein FRZ67_18625 [Panacibacter ginsenosidivorans]